MNIKQLEDELNVKFPETYINKQIIQEIHIIISKEKNSAYRQCQEIAERWYKCAGCMECISTRNIMDDIEDLIKPEEEI